MSNLKVRTYTDRRTFLAGIAGVSALGAVSSLPSGTARAEVAKSVKPYGIGISPEFPFRKKKMEVLESSIAYVDEGQGKPVVFLHGNPTSSYLWRNIIPHLPAGYRAIAPDLIGMGDSGKPDIGYTFANHAAYLDAFFEKLDLTDITFVIHDWGSALGMRYARLNPDRVAAVALMEAIIPPAFPVASFDDMPEQLADFFRLMRTEKGAAMVLEQNFFVEVVLPQMGVLRPMSDTEMAAYRAPFPTPESRKPVLAWPREVPIEGTPANVVKEVAANGDWLTRSPVPKILFYAEPGAIIPPAAARHLAVTVPNLETRFVGAGTHFIQEEHPHVIGQGLADWLRRI
jgi:haloalkane dehalogenase